VKNPCVAGLDSARELGEHGVMAKGPRLWSACAAAPPTAGAMTGGIATTRSRGAWNEATHKRLPEARPKPAHLKGD
jgi:hypothetical protein